MFVESILYLAMIIPLSSVVRGAFSYSIEGVLTLSPLKFCVTNTSTLVSGVCGGKVGERSEKGRQGQLLPPL